MKRGDKLLAWAFLVASLFGILIFFTTNNEPVVRVLEIPNIDGGGTTTMDIELESEQPQPKNITYNLTEVQNEVILEAKKYFDGINFYNFSIVNDANAGWMESHYNEGEQRIYIGLIGVEENKSLYKMVLTHEYEHYLLHKLGLSNDNAHEGIADVYTWFTNKEASKEVWGDKNQERQFPYTILTNKIIEENKEFCLNSVFNKEDKIDNFDDIVLRLNRDCEIGLVYIFNKI